jgi:hypothetical protein
MSAHAQKGIMVKTAPWILTNVILLHAAMAHANRSSAITLDITSATALMATTTPLGMKTVQLTKMSAAASRATR